MTPPRATAAVAFVAALLLAAAPALAQPQPARERQVTVANETDRTLQQLYVFPPGAAEQGADRLGSAVLPARATLRVPLGRTAACAFEVRAVFEDGEEARRRVDACRSPRATFADTGPRRDVEVHNDSELDLRELYLFPPGARGEGRDRLGSSTVPAGETFRVRLRGGGAQACVLDVRAVFTDDTEERRQRVDLCRAPRLAFGDPNLPTREVPVVNRARRTLRELYAAPTGAATGGGSGPRSARAGWGPDRLGSSVLSPREAFRLRVRGRGCAFDLRGVYEDDREEVQRNLDLCVVQGVVFGDRAAADAGGPRRVTLVNEHRRTIQQAFLSPSESDAWGEDVLGADVLRPGARREVELDEPGCRADLRIVFDTNAAEERRDVDVCAAATIALRPGWTVEQPLGSAEPAVMPAPAAVPPLAPASSPARTHGARLRNAAAVALVALYADPPGAAARGPNRLGRAELAPGEGVELAAPEGVAAPGDRCRADVTAVFADGREARLPDADLCAGEELVVR